MAVDVVKRAFVGVNNSSNVEMIIAQAKTEKYSLLYKLKNFLYNCLTLGFGKSMAIERYKRSRMCEDEIFQFLVALCKLGKYLERSSKDFEKVLSEYKTVDGKYGILFNKKSNQLSLCLGGLYRKSMNNHEVLLEFGSNEEFISFTATLSSGMSKLYGAAKFKACVVICSGELLPTILEESTDSLKNWKNQYF